MLATKRLKDFFFSFDLLSLFFVSFYISHYAITRIGKFIVELVSLSLSGLEIDTFGKARGGLFFLSFYLSHHQEKGVYKYLSDETEEKKKSIYRSKINIRFLCLDIFTLLFVEHCECVCMCTDARIHKRLRHCCITKQSTAAAHQVKSKNDHSVIQRGKQASKRTPGIINFREAISVAAAASQPDKIYHAARTLFSLSLLVL